MESMGHINLKHPKGSVGTYGRLPFVRSDSPEMERFVKRSLNKISFKRSRSI